MKTIAFFNNKGGVGKTSLVYHVGWMYADLGLNVIAADLDPQANLTSIFLEEDRLEELWADGEDSKSVYGAIQPLLEGTGDIRSAHVEQVADNLGLLVGDLRLSGSEDELNSQWPRCLNGDIRAFRVISAFYRLLLTAGSEVDVALIDVGPNLGAVNRAALIAADYVVLPLAPDIYSLQGLRNIGPTLRRWRSEWKDRLDRKPEAEIPLPRGQMKPLGYVVMQHAVRLDRPVKAYARWMARIPGVFAVDVMRLKSYQQTSPEKDPNCLATLKHYRSLMPMAMEAHKPIFHLKPADGAIGAHVAAVAECYADFKRLSLEIAKRSSLELP
jgi:chromosome partitioning protein